MSETPKKLVKLSSLKSDLKKEQEGDWVPAPDIGPGVAFLVRSTNYDPFRIARDTAMAALAKKYQDTPIPGDVLEETRGELFAEHLLLDWRGLDEDFDPDLARETLRDVSHRLIRGAVFIASTKVGVGEIEFVEKTAKN